MEANESLSKEDKRREISFPDRNEDLAEFFGILSGDGYMNEYPKRQEYVIEISGNKLKDFEYLNNFVSPLIKTLFNIEPKFYKTINQNTIFLRISSKGIFHFLRIAEFLPGRKKEIAPPHWITENKLFFKRFVRGFFDTDGYLCLKNKEGKKYPVAGLTSKSRTLIQEIKSLLEKFEISSCIVPQKNFGDRYEKESIVYKLQISGKKNIINLYREIGSNNNRNIIKFQEFFNGERGNRTPDTASFSRMLSH